MPQQIAVITGSRAEYGLLRGLLYALDADQAFALHLIVTGMHLSPEFGLTYREIERDGFAIAAKVELLLSSDTSLGTAKSVGLGVIGFADALSQLAPDLVIVLGDRFEIFAAVQAAFICRIPVAHLHGGETTRGAVDEAFRHCISKMAQWHFVAAEPYRQRVIQLGEEPQRVFQVGALSIDNVRNADLLSRQALAEQLQFSLDGPYFVVTYHPATLSDENPQAALETLIQALDQFSECKLIITLSNADSGGRAINQYWQNYAASQPHRIYCTASLGLQRYLSAVHHANAVIGNSSSGLFEVPALRVPSVNIGQRQQGRLAPGSVIHSAATQSAIVAAIKEALSPEFRAQLPHLSLPFGDGYTAQMIIHILKSQPLPKVEAKSFYDLFPTVA